MMGTKRKVGRNEPCPCGSGDKFKRCCLRKEKEEQSASIISFGDAKRRREFDQLTEEIVSCFNTLAQSTLRSHGDAPLNALCDACKISEPLLSPGAMTTAIFPYLIFGPLADTDRRRRTVEAAPRSVRKLHERLQEAEYGAFELGGTEDGEWTLRRLRRPDDRAFVVDEHVLASWIGPTGGVVFCGFLLETVAGPALLFPHPLGQLDPIDVQWVTQCAYDDAWPSGQSDTTYHADLLTLLSGVEANLVLDEDGRQFLDPHFDAPETSAGVDPYEMARASSEVIARFACGGHEFLSDYYYRRWDPEPILASVILASPSSFEEDEHALDLLRTEWHAYWQRKVMFYLDHPIPQMPDLLCRFGLEADGSSPEVDAELETTPFHRLDLDWSNVELVQHCREAAVDVDAPIADALQRFDEDVSEDVEREVRRFVGRRRWVRLFPLVRNILEQSTLPERDALQLRFDNLVSALVAFFPRTLREIELSTLGLDTASRRRLKKGFGVRRSPVLPPEDQPTVGDLVGGYHDLCSLDGVADGTVSKLADVIEELLLSFDDDTDERPRDVDVVRGAEDALVGLEELEGLFGQ